MTDHDPQSDPGSSSGISPDASSARAPDETTAVAPFDDDTLDDESVPEPAWVTQQHEEQAHEEGVAPPPAEAASAAGDQSTPQGQVTDQETPSDPIAHPEPISESESGPGEVEYTTPALPKLDSIPAPDEPRIIALINQKGGVGKTTTTVNLGAALAASGLRVLLIDLDPQAHLTLSLGIDPAELDLTLYDLLTDQSIAASEVVRIVENNPNLGVLPADTNLAGVESELAEMVQTGLAQTILRNKCADLFKQFDYIFIDCPPSLGLLTINGLTAAKEIIVPMQAHFLALQGMGKLFETINMIRQGINPQLTVSGVVLCMHEANTILASDVVSDVQGFFEEARGSALPWAGAVVYQPPVRRNIKLAEAPSFGQSVLTYAGDSNGAKDYAKLARSVAGVAAPG